MAQRVADQQVRHERDEKNLAEHGGRAGGTNGAELGKNGASPAAGGGLTAAAAGAMRMQWLTVV